MDRRKHQGVALLAGLLLLTLIIESIVLYCGASELQKQESQRLGAYVREVMEQREDAYTKDASEKERESVSLFHGKSADGNGWSVSEQIGNEEAGVALQEKYGYDRWSTSYVQVMLRYGFFALGIFLLAGGFAGVLLWKGEKREIHMSEEAERTRQRFDELQTHFQKVKHQLEKEEQETKTLITDISHQLKTPMASLQMSHEILETTDLTVEERADFQRKEVEELHKLGDLIDELLELSKLESKLIQLQPEPVSLRKTLTEAVNGVYMKAMEKQIDISMEKFEDISLNIDFRWTAEAFGNLLDNAIKYAPEQSEVRLQITKMVSYVLIEIEDQGIGITSEEAHQIFKRFYRGKSEKVKSQEGSGVGLYLARKIFEEQGGTVRVKQAAVQGSVFQVTLPLERR